MKRFFFICLISLLSMPFYAISFGQSYNSYVNNGFNYQIIVPESWKKEELNLAKKHFMYASKDAGTEIKVRAFKSSDEDIEKAVHQKKWDLRKIDPGLNNILETEKVTIKKNITGKLLIFEYRSLRKKYLQRVLVAQNDGIVYIIECVSPQDTFYKYEDAFTTALASFKYIKENSQPSVKNEVKEDEVDSTEDDGLVEEKPAPSEDEKI